MTSTLLMHLSFAAIAIASSAATQDTEREVSRLLVENVRGRSTDIENGVLRVRGKGGWARTRRIVSDFVLTGEFRLLSSATELQIGIRTINTVDGWPARGYRLRLSSTEPLSCAAAGYALTQNVGVPIRMRPDNWHAFNVSGNGRRIEISIDGQALGACDVELLAGAILFQTEGGDAEMRGLNLQVQEVPGIVRLKDHEHNPAFIRPRKTEDVKPKYPAKPLAASVQGVVDLEVVVLADGSIGAIKLTSLLHPELEHAALEAVRQWKFEPAVLNGTRIPVIMNVQVFFKLSPVRLP